MTTRFHIGAGSTRQAGSTLLEVLISVVVTSFGLLGLAGLMIVSQRVNQDAYLRTQANFLAQSIIDSMHVNPLGVTAGAYDGAFPADVGPAPRCEQQGCTPTQRARYDLAQLSQALDMQLPGAQALMRCTASAGVPPAPAAVYDGLCRFELGWVARALDSASANRRQSAVWVFQP